MSNKTSKMKKIILGIFVILLGFSSCQMNQTTDVGDVKKNLTYFRDGNTGLCFAVINSNSTQGGSYTSITCVPCDSLKRVNVK